MLSLVETLSKFSFQSANIIVEKTSKQGTLWLGDFTAAIDSRWQKQHGIVAVLTVAHGLDIVPDQSVAHKIIDAADVESYDISKDFDVGCDFISFWLNKGPVLVHCAAGVSRSASMVICYLMRTNKWSFAKTFGFVKSKRKVISPNDGFIRCLRKEEERLGLKRAIQNQNNLPQLDQNKELVVPQYHQPHLPSMSSVKGRQQILFRGSSLNKNSQEAVKTKQDTFKAKQEALIPLKPSTTTKISSRQTKFDQLTQKFFYEIEQEDKLKSEQTIPIYSKPSRLKIPKLNQWKF